MDNLITLSMRAEDYDGPTSWRLAKWCQKHGADEWTVSLIGTKKTVAGQHEQFEALVQPFRVSPAMRDNMTASPGKPFIRTTELWRLNSASFALLQQFLPEGLFTYSYDKDEWMEDIVLYRKGELILGVVSHEGEGYVRVTERERPLLEAERFVFVPRGNYVGYSR